MLSVRTPILNDASLKTDVDAAGGTATTYITDITEAGIYISPSNQSPTSSAAGNSVKIDGTGMEVYKGGDSVAFYGDTARIGKASDKRVEISSDAFAVVEANGYPQFAVDTGATSGTTTYSHNIRLDDSGLVYDDVLTVSGAISSLKVGANTGGFPGRSLSSVTMSVPTTIGQSTTADGGNDVDFTLTKLSNYSYKMQIGNTSGAVRYASYVYTTTSTPATIITNEVNLTPQLIVWPHVPITVTSGTLDDAEMVIYGRVCQLTLYVHKSSVASGSNVFEGYLSDYIPQYMASLSGYYGGRAAVAQVHNATGEIIIRNAGSSTMSPTASNPLIVSGTYIWDPAYSE